MKRGFRGFPLLPLLALGIGFAAGLYIYYVPGHPPGFSIDESSICYNAWTLSQTGQDEYGQSWPLFFRAFGEYKSPTIIYILAGLFKIAGPSIAAARLLTASLGVLAAVLLGTLSFKITRRRLVEAIVIVTALFTPWLFESSRLVFEVAVYPVLVALFLIAVWNAHERPRWNWRDALTLAVTLALLTYSYSIGRLLAPLLGLGLGLFVTRERWPGIAKTWLLYALLCVPLVLFHRQNPEALTGRFKGLTYLSHEASVLTNVEAFASHYLVNVNPWRWLFIGENNVRDHLEGTGALLFAAVVLAVAGVLIIVRWHRRDRWWRFVLYGLLVSSIPASLTANPFPQLRLIAFPIFFLLLTIPAIGWLIELQSVPLKTVSLGTAILLIAGQGWFLQELYHKKAPGLWYVFDARYPKKVLQPALRFGRLPVYLIDEPGKSGYIHALWYGVLNHLDPASFVRLRWGQPALPGAVVISTEEQCHDCRLVARALNYIVYMVPPYPNGEITTAKSLTDFAANIVCENFRPVMSAGQKEHFSFLLKNVSSEEWPCVGDPDNSTHAVTFQGRWVREDGAPGKEADIEEPLPYDIEPCDTVGLTLSITAPVEPGRYYFEADLVQKGIARFSERGFVPYRSAAEVVP
jgi:4-amino-4-deoxy-L-arabinose transferase-like glycosyltransferase